jgi:hypothetical protein
MSPVTNVWRQLVQRRLWPVAILLIAALAAVPMMLAKDPEPAVSPPPAAPDTTSELATTPIVTQATPADRAKRRKVLGAKKNPFATAKRKDPASALEDTEGPVVVKTPTGEKSGGDTGSSAGGDTSGGSAPSTGAPAPTTTTPAAPAPAPRKYAHEELTVRFGGAEDAKRRSVQRLQALPSAELPVLIYLGVLKDGKTAVFLVDGGVTPVGDGECKPSPDNCETIRLREGETEFLDVKDEAGNVAQQYQLDLIKIHNSSKASASKAGKSRTASTSRLRRSELRAVVGRVSAQLP